MCQAPVAVGNMTLWNNPTNQLREYESGSNMKVAGEVSHQPPNPMGYVKSQEPQGATEDLVRKEIFPDLQISKL